MATEAGLLSGRHGSLTQPERSDCIHGDGVVIPSLYKPKGPDPDTGEMPKRRDPDAGTHHTGDDRELHGTKFNMLFTRGQDKGSRYVLSVEHVERDEAGTAVEMLRRIRSHVPDAIDFLYDGALRGTHIDDVMTNIGMLTTSPMYPAKGAKNSGAERVNKKVPLIQPVPVRGGAQKTCRVVLDNGAPAVVSLNVQGDEILDRLELNQVRQEQNKDGTWRWYGDYELPAKHGGGSVLLRLNKTKDERSGRGANRTENLRVFHPESEQYKRLYGRRSDAESSNRRLQDTLWLGRAHCLGAKHQLLTLIGFQRTQNAIAHARHRARAEAAAPLIAA